MRPESTFLASCTKVDLAVSGLDRRVKAKPHEGVNVIDDLNQHNLLHKLIDLIPHLSKEVLDAFSPASAFQDLLLQASPPNNAPLIYQTNPAAFPTVLAALSLEKLGTLFRASTPALIVNALLARCQDSTGAIELLLSLGLDVELEDSVIDALGAADFGVAPLSNATNDTVAATSNPIANVPAGQTLSIPSPMPPTPSPTGPSPNPAQTPTAHTATKTLSSPNRAQANAVPSTAHTPNSSIWPGDIPPGIVAAAAIGLPTDQSALPHPVQPTPIANAKSKRARNAKDSSANEAAPALPPPGPAPPAATGKRTGASRLSSKLSAAAAVSQKETPTADALKARLLGRSGSSHSATKNALSTEAPPPIERPIRRPGPSRGSDEESSLSGGSDEYNELDELDSPVDDAPEPQSSSDNAPNVKARGRSRSKKGTTAAAAKALTAPVVLRDDFDEHAEIYGDAEIPTPAQFLAKHKAFVSEETRAKIRDFQIAYTDENSDPESWPDKLAKHKLNPDGRVDLPPVPRPTAIKARKNQWGTEYDAILQHEKQQFFRLPPLVKDLCGDKKGRARHTGDIYLRRFWAPYLYITLCIADKVALTTANSDLMKYTEYRFAHLVQPKGSKVSPADYIRPMRSFFNTVKKRATERLAGGVREPKVKQEHLDRAMSFMSGELRRAAAPALWYKSAGAAAVKEQVEQRLVEFAAQHSLAIGDTKVKDQRLGFLSAEMSRLFRLQPDDVQEEYRKLAEDPNMDATDFADASAPVLRSFLDAITEETGAIALCTFVVDTSQGPMLVCSQHGAQLQDRAWLQTQGTAFLQPFIKTASEIFKVELGNLPMVTARPAAPVAKIDHPWNTRSSHTLSLPSFRWPIAEHLTYNQGILQAAILNAIRTYSGASPSIDSVVDDVESWIVPGTMPERAQIMVKPSGMPPAMVEAWAKHWADSLDENSTLAPESRLRFHGQAFYKNPPALPRVCDPQTEVEREVVDPKGKGKGKSRQKTVPVARQKPSGLNVVVEISPPAGFDRSAYRPASKVGPPSSRKSRKKHSGAETAAEPPSPTITPESVAAAAMTLDSTAAAQSQTLDRMHDVDLDTQIPDSMDDPPLPALLTSLAMDIDPAHSQLPSRPLTAPLRRLQTAPPNSDCSPALVDYASEPETPARKAVMGRSDFASTFYPSSQITQPTSSSLLQQPSIPGPTVTPSEPAAVVTPAPPSAGPSTTSAAPSFPTLGTSQNPPQEDQAAAPDKPPKRPHPRSAHGGSRTAAVSGVRTLRDAPVLLKETVTYSLMTAKDRAAIQENLALWVSTNPWKLKSFATFMQQANKAVEWAIMHSSPLLGTLSHLFEAAVVTAWYTAIESPEQAKTRRKHRFRLDLPWYNLAAHSPADHVFQILLDSTTPLPLISSLTARDGGWDMPDVAQFMSGIVFSLEVAFNHVAGAPVGLLTHSWVDAIPLARAMAILRSNRSLHHLEGYSGPTVEEINNLTDRLVIFLNAVCVVRYLVHGVLQGVPPPGILSQKASNNISALWQRYIETTTTVIESVAAAAAAGRSDFFTFCLPTNLPPALAPVAQTINRHPKWWTHFQTGKTFGPKPLEIQTRNNLVANRLGKWCSTLKQEEWSSFSGLDRAVVAILLSIAILQEVGPDGPKDAMQIKDLNESLVCLQSTVYLSTKQPEIEGGPVFPRNMQSTTAMSLDWGSQHRWASCSTVNPSRLVDVDTDDEGEQAPFSYGFDQEQVVRDAAALAAGDSIPRTPKKSIFPRDPFGSSPPSSPIPMRVSNSLVASPAHDLETIPEDPNVPTRPDTPSEDATSSNGERPGQKRKKAKVPIPRAAKRTRFNASNDPEQLQPQASTSARRTRSAKKSTPGS